MYSGTTVRPFSGKYVGSHQKIDRLARAGLTKLVGSRLKFPLIKEILHFEGVNGPDAIKRKSPAQDEPWHYYRPFDETDSQLLGIIAAHYDALVQALGSQDKVRASFEAAWLAHALVDGLTPAHHYPYEEKLAELRGGAGLETRNTMRAKIVIPGDTRRQKVKNNWKMWGPKGLLMMHGAFELGVAFMLLPLTARHLTMPKSEVDKLGKYGVVELFKRYAKEIDTLGVYNRYEQTGWTPALALTVRKKVVPPIVHMVTLAWYSAVLEASNRAKR